MISAFQEQSLAEYRTKSTQPPVAFVGVEGHLTRRAVVLYEQFLTCD